MYSTCHKFIYIKTSTQVSDLFEDTNVALETDIEEEKDYLENLQLVSMMDKVKHVIRRKPLATIKLVHLILLTTR